MNLFQNRSVFVNKQRRKLFRLLFILLLLAALPLFIWAVLTQRIELRKRAATSEPTQICWNRVITEGGEYQWPDSCKGSPRTDLLCTQVLVPLTPEEINEFDQWVAMGKPYIPGCMPNTNQINWQTPQVSLQADEMTIEVNDLIFKGIPDPGTQASLRSDPGNYNYTTLESIWTEHGVEMRVFIYFTSNCSSSLPLQCNQWSVSEVRIYNGKTPGDWFVYTPSDNSYAFSQLHVPWGQAFTAPSLELSSSGGGVHVLTFNNLRLQPFLTQTNQTPTPTPLTCIRASHSISVLQPSHQSVYMDMPATYQVVVTNNDRGNCPAEYINLSYYVPSGWVGSWSDNNLYLSPNSSAVVNFTVTPHTATPTYGQEIAIQLNARMESRLNGANTWAYITIMQSPTTTPTPTPTPVPAPQQMTLRVKLAGVSDGSAEGAKIAMKFYKKDGSILQLSEPLTLTYAGAGIYETTAIVTNPFSQGTQFRLKIKGEKHVGIEFCRGSGQTVPCGDNDYITVPAPAPTDLVYDFTGIPLPPGDLAPQDGQASRSDLDKLPPLMSKVCENLTVAEKLIGDVDYNGCVNVRDVFLILQTLETRYDE